MKGENELDRLQEIYKDMEELVKTNCEYYFQSLDDEDSFEPFYGVPVKVGTEMAVRVTKDNGTLDKNEVVWIDPNEFCFMEITKQG